MKVTGYSPTFRVLSVASSQSNTKAHQPNGMTPRTKDKKTDGAESASPATKAACRLQHALVTSEANRTARIEQVKAKTGRTDLPVEQRKLTQQEAAAYCDVSTATIHRWTKAGLKTVAYGKRKRFLVQDLQEFMLSQRATGRKY